MVRPLESSAAGLSTLQDSTTPSQGRSILETTTLPAAVRLQARLQDVVAKSSFDQHLDLHNTITLHEVVSLPNGGGRTTAFFTVAPVHTNRFRNLHGACATAVLEAGCLSALAAASRPGFWETLGVGRSLRVVYLSTVKEGERCWIESEVVKAGTRMCLIKSEMRKQSTGEIVATCEHERANLDKQSQL